MAPNGSSAGAIRTGAIRNWNNKHQCERLEVLKGVKGRQDLA